MIVLIHSSHRDAISVDVVHVLDAINQASPPYAKIFRIELFYKVIPVCTLLQWQKVGGGILIILFLRFKFCYVLARLIVIECNYIRIGKTS